MTMPSRPRSSLPVFAMLALAACTEERAPPAPVPPISAGPLVRTDLTFPEALPNASARAALPPAEARKIDASPVPVLVPGASGAAHEVRLMVEPGFYAYFGVVEAKLADGAISRASISVQGTRFSHRHEDFPQDVSTHTLRGRRGLFTVNEGIVTTTWVEGGASYSVDVECSVAGDPRCADERFVLALTEGLAFVGGRR